MPSSVTRHSSPRQRKTASRNGDVFRIATWINVLALLWTLMVVVFFWISVALCYSDAEDTAWAMAENLSQADLAEPGAGDSARRGAPKNGQPLARRISESGDSGDTWEVNNLANLRQSGGGETRELHVSDSGANARLLRLSRTPSRPGALAAFSARIPMEPLWKAARDVSVRYGVIYAILWLTGLGVLFWGGRLLKRRVVERDAALAELERLAQDLEEKVDERTEALRQSKTSLETFMNNANAGTYLKDSAGKFVMVNRQLLSILGCSADRLIGRYFPDQVDPGVVRTLTELEHHAGIAGAACESEVTFRFPDGDRPFSALVFPVRNDSGRLTGVGGMLVDIAHRKRLEGELKRAKDEAEHANRAKSRFLANTSHEIRTPLNGVLGMADLLLQTQLDAEQSSMAATIRSSGDSLLAVLNDILDFSKIEAGKLQIEHIPFSLRDVLHSAVKAMLPASARKSLEIIVRIGQGVRDSMMGDPNRIKQICLNLISNAIKFTDSGEIIVSVIALSASESKTRLRIAVKDTGIGIRPEKQKGIFAAFEQEDASTTRKYGGTGLGLAISASLAKMMGSELRLSSCPGRGSLFWMDIGLELNRTDTARLRPLTAKEMENIRILLVDDSEVNRRILTGIFAPYRARTDACSSADAAWTSLNRAREEGDPYRLLVVDQHMPDKDGGALLRQICSAREFSELQMILLTTGASCNIPGVEGSRYRRYEKPIRGEELVRLAATLLGLPIQDGKVKPNTTTVKSRYDHRLRMLLVEDMRINQMVAKSMLDKMGHVTNIANNGQEAVDLYSRSRLSYDLILMDIQMPVMDGETAANAIREIELAAGDGRRVPIVAMTANAMSSDREKYLAAGFDGYITKPLFLQNLVELVDDMVETFNLKSRRSPDSARM